MTETLFFDLYRGMYNYPILLITLSTLSRGPKSPLLRDRSSNEFIQRILQALVRVRAKGVWSTWLQLRSLGQHGILSALGCVPRREEIRFGVAVSGVHRKPDFLPWRHLSGFEASGFKTRGHITKLLLGDVGDVCFFLQ